MEIFALYCLTFAFMFAKSKVNKEKTEFFSGLDGLVIKGFFAIVIILHHLGQQFDLGVFSAFNSKMGGVGVGVFFMLSSYGILKSCKKNEYNYLKKLFLSKILKLYLFQVIINFLYYLVLKPSDTSINLLLRVLNLDIFVGLERINSFSWFITTILFCYLSIAISLVTMRLFKVKNKKIFLGTMVSFLTFILGVCLFIAPVSNLYKRCLSCFIIGLLLFMFEDKLLQFLSNKLAFTICIVSFAVLSIVGIILLNEEFAAVFICLLLIVAFKYISIENNVGGLFLGKISLSIYLMQYMFFVFISKTNILLYSFSIIGGTITLAYLTTILLNSLIKAVEWCKSINKKQKNDGF